MITIRQILFTTSLLANLAIAQNKCTFVGEEFDHEEAQVIKTDAEALGYYEVECTNGTISCHQCSGMADAECDTVDTLLCEGARREENGKLQNGERRLGVYGGKYIRKWPGGVLCYQNPRYLNSKERGIFFDAIRHITQKTGRPIIDIRNCASSYGRSNKAVCGGCKTSVRIVRGGGCKSFIGWTKRRNQDLSLDPSCFNGGRGTVVHEILHAFGMKHEHASKNRNIIVLRVKGRLPADNYFLDKGASATAWDPYSVMHYSLSNKMCVPKAQYRNVRFCDLNESSRTGCTIPTSTHCDQYSKWNRIIGKGNSMSNGDIAAIKAMYGTAARPTQKPVVVRRPPPKKVVRKPAPKKVTKPAQKPKPSYKKKTVVPNACT